MRTHATRIIGRFSWAAAIVTAMLAPATAQATIITLYNFNDMGDNGNGTTVANMGTSTLTLVEDSGMLADANGQRGTTFVDADGTLHPDPVSSVGAAGWTDGVLNSSVDPNDYWLLDMSTSNFQNVSLRFDYRITSVSETQIGPSELLLEYAVDGGAFLSAGTTALTRNNNWNELTFDLAALGLDDTAEVQIRGTWSNDGVGSVSARLDHLQVTGDAIPEPASLALIGFGALLAIRRRRA